MIPCNFNSDLAAFEAKEVQNDMRDERCRDIARLNTEEKMKALSVLAVTEAIEVAETKTPELVECLLGAYARNDTNMIGSLMWQIVYLYWFDIHFDEAMDTVD